MRDKGKKSDTSQHSLGYNEMRTLICTQWGSSMQKGNNQQSKKATYRMGEIFAHQILSDKGLNPEYINK